MTDQEHYNSLTETIKGLDDIRSGHIAQITELRQRALSDIKSNQKRLDSRDETIATQTEFIEVLKRICAERAGLISALRANQE